jgi:hypothetical protein
MATTWTSHTHNWKASQSRNMLRVRRNSLWSIIGQWRNFAHFSLPSAWRRTDRRSVWVWSKLSCSLSVVSFVAKYRSTMYRWSAVCGIRSAVRSSLNRQSMVVIPVFSSQRGTIEHRFCYFTTRVLLSRVIDSTFVVEGAMNVGDPLICVPRN